MSDHLNDPIDVPGKKTQVNQYPALWPEAQPFGAAAFDHPEERQSLLQYCYAILYRKWWVAGVFTLIMSISGFYASRIVPLYKSSSTIEVEKVYPSSTNLADLFQFFGQFDLYYQTQLESLKSRALGEKFLAKYKQKIAEAAAKAGDTSKAVAPSQAEAATPTVNELDYERRRQAEIDAALARVTISPVRNTQLIQIDMVAADPLAAKRMLETYLETFVEEDRRRRQDIAHKVKSWLANELEDSKRALDESQANYEEFNKKHGIVIASKDQGPALGAFEKAGEQLIQSKDTRMNLEMVDQEKIKMLPPQLTTEYLQQLRGQLAALKSEYQSMRSIYSPDYFKMVLLNSRIKSLEKAIKEIEESAVSSALDAAKRREEISGETYEKTRQEAMEMNALSVQMETLRKLVEANRQAYIMIMQKAKQAELDRVFSGSNISILSPPSVPLGAVSPNKGRIVLIGALLGLLGGIGFALVIDHFDTSAQKPQDVEKLLNVPILGTLPLVGSPARFMEELRINSRMDPKVSTVEFAAFKFPTAPFTDAIRIVQNAASGALRAGPGGVAMCVSSALPLEGKTLIAVFMATVTATEDKKVLVIDGDMRRPRIQQVFKASSDLPGLSDVLSGKCENIREVIHRSKVPGLFYMTAGSPPDNPVSLLKSDKFKEMLDTCRGWFDYVFIDTPPILGLVDTTVLAGNVDGTVLVAKAGHTPLEVLRQAKETVSRGQGRILGVVLNMADQKAHRYTAYRYFGYNYYSHNYYSKRENNDKQA